MLLLQTTEVGHLLFDAAWGHQPRPNAFSGGDGGKSPKVLCNVSLLPIGGVPFRGMAFCGVLWLWRGVAWWCAVWCSLVCRRCCYQKAMAGMVLHAGECKPGGLCV